MNKRFTLAISDTVLVPVAATINDESGKPVNHKFTLECKRLSHEEFKSRINGDATGQEIMAEVTTGWKGQHLVKDEAGKPADFCAEALATLFDISGMAIVCFNAYCKEASAKAKN